MTNTTTNQGSGIRKPLTSKYLTKPQPCDSLPHRFNTCAPNRPSFRRPT